MLFATTTFNFRFLNKLVGVCAHATHLFNPSLPLLLSLSLPPSLMCMIYSQVGEMFIVCGVLYAIDSVTERNTKILLALDLYRGYVLNDINLSFTNPFKNTTMALYNPETKVFPICSATLTYYYCHAQNVWQMNASFYLSFFLLTFHFFLSVFFHLFDYIFISNLHP